MKTKHLIVGIAATALLSYLWMRRQKDHAPPLRGGMKSGFNPALINPHSTYENEGERKRDVVDQASWESMDASDAPAY